MTPPSPLFSPRVDWTDGWKESLEWLTDVLTADDDSEQRISLRSKPRRTLEFTAKAQRSREAALLGDLIWGRQAQPLGFPVWPDALWIGATVSSGDTSLSVDTSLGGVVNREFVASGFVGLWRDPFTWEVRTISSVTPPGTIAIDALENDWPLGTAVFPVTVAMLRPEIQQRRISGAISSISIVADCDVLADTAMAAAATWSGTQLSGVDLLATMPDGAKGQKTTIRRTMLREDSLAGVFGYFTPNGVPILTRDMDWFLKTRDAIAQYKGFLARRYGRWSSFLAPTWRQDLELALPVAAADASLTIRSCGYSAYAYPTSTSRRSVALITPGPAITPASVIGATDNGDGTETLALAAPAGVDLDLDGTISFLTGVRLASDTVEIDYATSVFARASTPVTEVPSTTVVSRAVDIPVGVYLTAQIAALAGPMSAGLAGAGLAIRFRVDPLLAGGEVFGAIGSIGSDWTDTGGGLDARSKSLDLAYATDGAGNVGIFTNIGDNFRGNDVEFATPAFTVAQSSLPSAGTYVVIWLTFNNGANGGGVVVLTDDSFTPLSLINDMGTWHPVASGVRYGWAYYSAGTSYTFPAGNTFLYLGNSFQTIHTGIDTRQQAQIGGITVDGAWVMAGTLAGGARTLTPNAAAPVVVFDNPDPLLCTAVTPGVLGIYTFDDGTLNEAGSGPILLAEGGSVSFLREGLWGHA